MHFLKIIILFVFSSVSHFSYAAADFADGYDAYLAKDYQKVIELWTPFAEEGNLDAQVTLGEIYMLGLGVEQNYQLAFLWYRKAARQGSVEAQFNLAVLYENGLGTFKNKQQAIKWYMHAGEEGHVDAMKNVSKLINKPYAYLITKPIIIDGAIIGLSSTDSEQNLNNKYLWIRMPEGCFDASEKIFVHDGMEFMGGEDTRICSRDEE